MKEDANRDFRLGLEDLVKGHIDGCMTALGSCSSVRTLDDEEEGTAAAGEGAELLIRRRRRSDLEGDDLAESSAAARRHSRILSRWVARQAEEMITTIERRNRESELMALAGLHTVSMLDSSFLRESRRSQVSVERPVAARASSILQRWRELEVQAEARDRMSQRRATVSSGNRVEAGSMGEDNEFSEWAHSTLHQVNRSQDLEADGDVGRQSSLDQSPDLADVERERVRQIIRGWMPENGTAADDSTRLMPRNGSSQSEWLGETERERVRLVREWMQMTSQQTHSRASMGEVQGREREREREESVTDHTNSQPEPNRPDLHRLRGRQVRMDLIVRFVRERQRELQGLSEYRAVSEFAHRSRIQSFLRGRFLRNGGPEENERPPSVASRELGQLRQRHPVSGLREGFRIRLENNARGHANVQAEGRDVGTVSENEQRNDQQRSIDVLELASLNQEHLRTTTENYETHQTAETQSRVDVENLDTSDNMDLLPFMTEADNWQEQNAQPMAHGRQQSVEATRAWHNANLVVSEDNWHEQMDQEWTADTPEDVNGEGHALEAHNWHENDSHVTIENWEDGPSDPLRDQHSTSARRVNRFIPPDDDNLYSLELRELLSRRSVSTVLRSGFRESLDQLIQSYVQRQGHAHLEWDLQRPLSTPFLTERDQGHQSEAPILETQNSVSRPPVVFQSPPAPPPQPLWHSTRRPNNWNRHSIHRSEIEWDAITELKADMARLQQGMSHMQRMLEACMDMQLELQRSVRQEVSAALNRDSSGQGGTSKEPGDVGTKFSLVKNGTCCVCCDNLIDTLLYRCGHMCTCSKCANELVRDRGKCPLCRAPITEVIRAYSIL